MNTEHRYNFLGKTFFYGVETLYGAAQDVSLSYIISCQYLSYTEASQFIVALQRKQVFINGTEPQKMVDQLADACMQCLYPIECVVSKNGQFIKLHNYQGLRKKWQEGLPKIRERYKGHATNSYLQQIGDHLATEDLATQTLLKDVVYHLLFPKSLNNTQGTPFYFPTHPSQPLEPYFGTTTALKHQRLKGLRFKGTDAYNGTLDISRWLYKEDLSLCKIQATYSLNETLVHYTLTRLKERETDNPQYIEATPPELEVTPKKKKRKWLIF